MGCWLSFPPSQVMNKSSLKSSNEHISVNITNHYFCIDVYIYIDVDTHVLVLQAEALPHSSERSPAKIWIRG